nr:DUF4349 domain-containing protein [Propionibacterium sp.]
MNAPRTVIAAAIAALALALGGCSAQDTQVAPANPPADTRANEGAGAAPGAAPDSEDKTADVTTADRQVARTAQVTVKVADPAVAAAKIRAAAEGLGGYVAAERIVTEQRDGYYLQSSTVTVKVPSEQLDVALDGLAAVGTVTDRVVNSTDVTVQVVDVEARIKTLRESIARIEQLMTKAGTVAEIAQVEAELTSRQSQLESLVAQQQTLAARVAMATIAITLTPQVTVTEPNPLLQGLEAGWEALLVSLRWLITFLGAALPFAAIALVVWLPVRAWLRRRTPRAAAASAASPAEPSAPARPGQAGGAGPEGPTPPTASDQE